MSALSPPDFIDVHYHVNPDAYVRRHSAIQAGSVYAKHNGWVILKNHLGCTAAQAWEAREQGVPVFGSVVLNEIAGGINYRVVEHSLCRNGDNELRFIVHMPTVTGRSHQSSLMREISNPILTGNPIKPLTVSNDTEKLTAATLDIFRMARDFPLVISTGHANKEEVRLLVDAAVKFDVRLMLNQPANPLTGLTADELLEISQAPNIYVEQTSLTYLLGYQDRDDYYKVLENVPRAIYSSDLGQTSQPDIETWRRLSEKWFSECNLSPQRIHALQCGNPGEMLAL